MTTSFKSALLVRGALAAAVLAATGTAVAADEETGSSYDNYVYFGGFYMRADKDRSPRNESGDSFGYQAAVGQRINDNLWVEGQFFGDTIETGTSNGTDFYQTGLGVDLQYAFGQRSEFTPYILAGIGGVYNDVPGRDEVSPYANIGVGFTKSILGFDGLRLRGELRAVYDDYNEDTGGSEGKIDYRAGLGLEMAIGKTPEPEVIIKEVPVEKVVIKEVPVERVVIKEPEPVDDDSDGVINAADKCPNTPAGAKVDGNGCVIEQTLVMRDITFDFDSARLTTNAQRLMENAVAFLRSDSSARVTIAGHTDNRGSDSYNLKLSRDRANEVRDYLIGYGIEANRLQAVGYGETRPVASNDNEAGREVNRRVEFRIQK
ncbi:OOP family OmpA-OmpF porin [Paraperlucidibaca baekdonensis]|uniref:OOP family OmpA-OmpF porin n=1 Tax=Paraperlucidibaca baekdonensis TaxID=748120 RepID=A0A3E0H4N8_9GAMM|nr:OmpA family protein [Paraperlucidibaca baekdonensis]REH37863.1 OOP family OmpA-OmpF porin [Paraperlucidibaca baekdonensis]